MYCRVPDPEIPLTDKGKEQAEAAGNKLRDMFSQDPDYKVFFYLSPYRCVSPLSEWLCGCCGAYQPASAWSWVLP
eukprot:1174301-Prorocentrum_minimum.AAC.1